MQDVSFYLMANAVLLLMANAVFAFKKIQTRLTEHQNAINRHDHNSLPSKYADDNGHKFG